MLIWFRSNLVQPRMKALNMLIDVHKNKLTRNCTGSHEDTLTPLSIVLFAVHTSFPPFSNFSVFISTRYLAHNWKYLFIHAFNAIPRQVCPSETRPLSLRDGRVKTSINTCRLCAATNNTRYTCTSYTNNTVTLSPWIWLTVTERLWLYCVSRYLLSLSVFARSQHSLYMVEVFDSHLWRH